MIVNTKELLNAVKSATKFTPRGNRVMPILQNIWLKAEDGILSVTSTDLDSSIRIDIEVKNIPLDVCVNAQLFSQALTLTPDETITLDVDKEKLILGRSSGKIKFAAISPQQFPLPVFANADAPSFSFEAKDLNDALRLSGFALNDLMEYGNLAFRSTAEFRIDTNLIESKFTIKATNEHILSVVKGLCEKSDGLDDSALAFPKQAVQKTIGILPADGAVSISHDDNHIFVSFGDTSCSFRKSSAVFPDMSKATDAEFPIVVKTNASELFNAVQGGAMFSDISVWNITDGAIEVTANGKDLGEFNQEVTAELEADEAFEVRLDVKYINSVLSRLSGDVELTFRPSQGSYAMKAVAADANVKGSLYVQCLQKMENRAMEVAA